MLNGVGRQPRVECRWFCIENLAAWSIKRVGTKCVSLHESDHNDPEIEKVSDNPSTRFKSCQACISNYYSQLMADDIDRRWKVEWFWAEKGWRCFELKFKHVQSDEVKVREFRFSLYWTTCSEKQRKSNQRRDAVMVSDGGRWWKGWGKRWMVAGWGSREKERLRFEIRFWSQRLNHIRKSRDSRQDIRQSFPNLNYRSSITIKTTR